MTLTRRQIDRLRMAREIIDTVLAYPDGLATTVQLRDVMRAIDELEVVRNVLKQQLDNDRSCQRFREMERLTETEPTEGSSTA